MVMSYCFIGNSQVLSDYFYIIGVLRVISFSITEKNTCKGVLGWLNILYSAVSGIENNLRRIDVLEDVVISICQSRIKFMRILNSPSNQ